MNRRILFLILLASVLSSSALLSSNARADSGVPPNGGGSPPPTLGAPVYFSVEPVAVVPLINLNASVNGLEVSSSPSAVGQNFTVETHLRNATATNVPAGVAGVYVDFDFTNILDYCKPIGFTTMLGQPGGALTGSLLYAVDGGFYDVNGNPVNAADYSQATQYAVMAGSTGEAGWNNDDGLVAQVTFQITGQPSGALNQSAFYSQLHMSYAELVDYNVSEIPYSVVQGPYGVVQGTLKIDALNTILGDLNNDGKVGLDDLQILAAAYGSKPRDPNWNPAADLLGHGKVDLGDLVTLANHYGQHV